MDEAQAVLDRLERIATLDDAGVEPSVLVRELRSLLEEATAWSHREGGEVGERAVGTLRAALQDAPGT